MKTLACSQLVPHCPAQFDAGTEREVIEQYAAHARSTHREPVELLAVVNAIAAA